MIRSQRRRNYFITFLIYTIATILGIRFLSEVKIVWGTTFTLAINALRIALTSDEEFDARQSYVSTYMNRNMDEPTVLGPCIWVEPSTTVEEMVNQEHVELWLIAQRHHDPKTIDRPYLMRTIKKHGVQGTAETVARSLYTAVAPRSTIDDLISAMKKSYLPIVPVVEVDQIVGTIGYKELHALHPAIAKELEARVRPHPE